MEQRQARDLGRQLVGRRSAWTGRRRGRCPTTRGRQGVRSGRRRSGLAVGAALPASGSSPLRFCTNCEPEPPLDAEVTARHVVVRAARSPSRSRCPARGARAGTRRRSTGRSCSVTRLLRLVPGARLAHLVLAREHQRARRTHPDAVAAVHARGLVERHRVLGGDPRVEPAAGHGDREGVLCVDPAGLDALVAEDAARVVADVQLVVDLHRLARRPRPRWGPGARGGGPAPSRRAPLPSSGAISRAEALGVAPRTRPSSDGRRRSRDPSRPTRPGTPSRACASAARARCRSSPSCRARPCGEHAGTSTREPSTSTTQTRQAFTGVRFSA